MEKEKEMLGTIYGYIGRIGLGRRNDTLALNYVMLSKGLLIGYEIATDKRWEELENELHELKNAIEKSTENNSALIRRAVKKVRNLLLEYV